jgi:hypothetical protein
MGEGDNALKMSLVKIQIAIGKKILNICAKAILIGPFTASRPINNMIIYKYLRNTTAL